jgi:membrane protease YdiL (CAAX protease family)
MARKLAVLLMPPPLVLSTWGAFHAFDALLGPEPGYFAGFLFYWVAWCLGFPLLILGPRRLGRLFHDTRPRLGKPTWAGALALGLPPVIGFGAAFPSAIAGATGLEVMASAVLAAVNATAEEILWRGLFVETFPSEVFRGYAYPTLWFGLWHISPQQVIFPNPRPGGVVSFVVAAAIWGLCYGWVAWRTGSIRWTTLSHVLLDFSGLGARIYLR